MTKGLFFAASFVCLALSPVQSRHSGVMRVAQSAPVRGGATVQSAPSSPAKAAHDRCELA